MTENCRAGKLPAAQLDRLINSLPRDHSTAGTLVIFPVPMLRQALYREGVRGPTCQCHNLLPIS